MFPCAHVYYSLMQDGGGSGAQVVGAILPDAATTATLTWTDLHDAANIDAFAAVAGGDAELGAVILGVRHHLELDIRSHDSWRGGGGYAYERQTEQLQKAVQTACDVDDERARTLAHNFIETAVDLHLLMAKPGIVERIRAVLIDYDVSLVSGALAAWKGSDPVVASERLQAFFDIWLRHDLATVEGMVELWSELLERLNRHTFDAPFGPPLQRSHARDAIGMALELTESDFMDVVTP